MIETYPPDKTVLINKIKATLIELNELEDYTENSYRWALVKQTGGFDPMAFYEEFVKIHRVVFRRESEWIYYIIPTTKDLDKLWNLGIQKIRDWLMNKYLPTAVKDMIRRLILEFDVDDLLIRFEGVRGRYYAEIVIGLRYYPKMELGT